VRRRRATLVAALLLVAGGAIAAVVALRSGPSGTATEPAAARAAVAPREASRARPSAPARFPSAAEQRAAVARLVRLGIPIHRAGSRGDAVALTFDDGPGRYTTTALRALRQARAHATFFLVGRNLAEWPQVPAQEARLGAVGDHTWTHPVLTALPSAEMASEIARTQAAAARASGADVMLFRPPYGAHSPAVDDEARRLGMLEVLWSIDSRDSEGATWDEMLRSVEGKLRPGAIVLFHENRGQSLKTLNRLLPWMRRHGLRSVSVPELLALDPPSVAQVRADERGAQPSGGG
jgi:peptidoglycan-N-acetylglucosamine deacetylase